MISELEIFRTGGNCRSRRVSLSPSYPSSSFSKGRILLVSRKLWNRRGVRGDLRWISISRFRDSILVLGGVLEGRNAPPRNPDGSPHPLRTRCIRYTSLTGGCCLCVLLSSSLLLIAIAVPSVIPPQMMTHRRFPVTQAEILFLLYISTTTIYPTAPSVSIWGGFFAPIYTRHLQPRSGSGPTWGP